MKRVRIDALLTAAVCALAAPGSSAAPSYISTPALSLAALLIGFELEWLQLAAAVIGLGAAALVIVRSLRGKERLSIALVGLLLGVSETAFAADGLTARARLEQAAAEARKWKPGAVLMRVGTTDVDKSKAVMRGWCVDPKGGQFVTRLAGEG